MGHSLEPVCTWQEHGLGDVSPLLCLALADARFEARRSPGLTKSRYHFLWLVVSELVQISSEQDPTLASPSEDFLSVTKRQGDPVGNTGGDIR